MKRLTVEQLLTVAKDAILSTYYCFLITISESGVPNARLMQPYEPEDDLTVFLGSSPQSRKVSELQGNNRASLAYHSLRENAYVTMIGTASIENDVATRQKYWRDEWKIFFPGGPLSGDYTLVRFAPCRIEVMNLARNIYQQPYGLRPCILVRENDTWVASEY